MVGETLNWLVAFQCWMKSLVVDLTEEKTQEEEGFGRRRLEAFQVHEALQVANC